MLIEINEPAKQHVISARGRSKHDFNDAADATQAELSYRDVALLELRPSRSSLPAYSPATPSPSWKYLDIRQSV